MNKLDLSANKISISPLEQPQNNQFQSATKKTNRNILYRNSNYNSDFVKFKNLRNLTKDEFINKSVKSNNSSFKGSGAYNLETGLIKQKEKLAQTFLVPFFEAVKNSVMSKPSLISFKGSEPEVAEVSLLESLNNAQTREDFVAIRDEINEMPNGKERKALVEAYLKAYNEWLKSPQRPDIRMEYNPDEAQFKELTDAEFKAMKPQVEAELEAFLKQDHQYINILRSKLRLLKLNKYNIELVDKLIKTPELNNSKNIIENIDDVIGNIKNEYQAKVGKVILENSELFNNRNFIDNVGNIIKYSETQESVKGRIDVMNYIKQNPEWLNNQNFADNVGNIISGSNSKESSEAQINVMNCIKQNSELMNNQNFADNVGNIIYCAYSQESAEVKIDVMNYICENSELMNNKNFADNVGQIIQYIETKERAEVAKYICENSEWMNNKNFADNVGEIIYYSDSQESVDAKINLMNYIKQNSELMNNKNFTENFGEIIRYSDNQESSEARINVMNYIKQNPEWMNNKSFTDNVGEIILCSNSKGNTEGKIDVMNYIKQNPELMNNQNFTDNVGKIIYYSGSKEGVKVAKYIYENPELMNNQNFADNVFKIISSSETKESAEVAKYICENLELMNNKSFVNNVGNIIYSSNSQESVESRINLMNYIKQNPELMNNKNFADNVGEIIFRSYSKESSEAKINLVNYIKQNPELMNYQSFIDNVGNIIYSFNSQESFEVRIDLMNYIKQNLDLMNNKNFNDKVVDIILCSNTKERAIVAKYICENPELMDNKNFADNVFEIISISDTKEKAENVIKYFKNSEAIDIHKFILENKEKLQQHNIDTLTNRKINDLMFKEQLSGDDYDSERIKAQGIDGLVNLLDVTDPQTIKHAKELKYSGFKDFLLYGSQLNKLTPETKQLLKEKLAKFPMPEQRIEKLQVITALVDNISQEELLKIINDMKSPTVTLSQQKAVNRIFATDKPYSDRIDDFIFEFNVPINRQEVVRKYLQDAKLNEKFINPQSVEEQIASIDKKIFVIQVNDKIPQEKKEVFLAQLESLKQKILSNPQEATAVKINDKAFKALAAQIEAHINLPNTSTKFNTSINQKVYDKLGINVTPELLSSINYDSKYFARLFPGMNASEFKDEYKNLIELMNDNPNKSLSEVREAIPENNVTRELFKQNGLNYDKWIKFDKTSNHKFVLIVKKDEIINRTLKNLNEEMRGFAFTNLPKEQQEILREKISEEISKIEKGDDLTKYNLKVLITTFDIIQNEIKMNKFYAGTTPEINTFKDNINIHSKDIKKAKQVKDRILNLEVRLSNDDDIGRNIFLGNHVGCCTSIGAFNSFASPQHLMNSFVRAIEIVDAKGNSFGNSMCYFAKVDGKLTFVIDSFEVNGKLSADKAVTDAIITYAKQVCNEMGQPEANIMFGPFHKINIDRCIMTEDHSVEIIGKAPECTYIDAIGGKNDINVEHINCEMYEIMDL